MDTNYSLADIAAATGNGRNDGMWGGDGCWWIILFLLFGMFGWGGFGGGFGGYGGGWIQLSGRTGIRDQNGHRRCTGYPGH